MLALLMNPFLIRTFLWLICLSTRTINRDRSKTILLYWCSASPSRTISIFDRSVSLKARTASMEYDVNRPAGVRLVACMPTS
uniref:Putative trypsin-like serine protease n=1 Tax=Anopheles darlingi TaxID=43151 RepID=A0A2M4D1Z2_ANODA